MDRTTFTFREALGRPIYDEVGTLRGLLADLELRPRTDGRTAVELVVRDGPAEFLIPGSGILRFDEERLTAPISGCDRIWGDPERATLRLRSDWLHALAIDLGRARIVRVRDVRLSRIADETVVIQAVTAPPGPFRSRGLGWVPWGELIPLRPLLDGRLGSESLARLVAMPPLRLAAVLAGLQAAERDRFRDVLEERRQSR